jgi:hypothetical protein
MRCHASFNRKGVILRLTLQLLGGGVVRDLVGLKVFFGFAIASDQEKNKNKLFILYRLHIFIPCFKPIFSSAHLSTAG